MPSNPYTFGQWLADLRRLGEFRRFADAQQEDPKFDPAETDPEHDARQRKRVWARELTDHGARRLRLLAEGDGVPTHGPERLAQLLAWAGRVRAKLLAICAIKPKGQPPNPFGALPSSVDVDSLTTWEAADLLVDGGGNRVPQGGSRRGVSLMDAAERIRPDDPAGQRQLGDQWRKLRKPKLPAPIGKCPNHSQRNLYEPAAILRFLKEVEGPEVDRDFALSAYFRTVSRQPRPAK